MNAKNGAPPAPALLTLGAVSNRLLSNGYLPCSALRPDGRLIVAGVQTRYEPWATHVTSEDPPAIVVRTPLVVLVFEPALLEGKELERRVRSRLGDLLKGPVRIGSDGVEARVIRLVGNVQSATALDEAVTIDYARNVGTHIVPAVLPCDGRWPSGDLTDERHSAAKLPQIDADDLRALFRELASIPYKLAREKEPPPKPTRRAYLGGAA
jgi:hypothetical protein